MTDIATQLATLRALRDAATDPQQQAAFDAAIAALEQQSRSHTMTVADDADVGAAVAGDVHGDVNTGPRYEAFIQVFVAQSGIVLAQEAQREALASYLASLARRCDKLRLHGVVDWERKRGKAPDFTLSQVYVTLAATSWVTVDAAEREDAFADAVQQGNPDDVLPQDARRIHQALRDDGLAGEPRRRGEAAQPQVQLQRPRLLTEAVSEGRHLVVLGGPGSGKSSFVRHLAVGLARSNGDPQQLAALLPGWSAGTLLPIMISLGDYATWTQEQQRRIDAASLWDYLIAMSAGVMIDDLKPQVQTAFQRGTLLLLLDGLDEVAEPALRAAVARAIVALGEQGASRIVVTCRVKSFTGAIAEPFATQGEPVELAPFTLGQIRHFVRGWYQRSTADGVFDLATAQARAEELLKRIAALPTLRDLGQTPLLLTIITILHYYEGKLPEDRAELYEDLVELLLTRWTQSRREAGAPPSLLEQLAVPGLRDFHLRGTIEALAYRAHQAASGAGQRGVLERATVREALIALFQQFDLGDGPANEKAMQVLRYLDEESGLLLYEGGDRYALPHLTYEEYLAACYLVKQEQDFETLAYQHWQADAGRWREVILLALGRMIRSDKRESAAGWLRFLGDSHHGERERPADELQPAVLFAADCLADIGDRAALYGVTKIALPTLWQRMAAVLAETVEGQTLPAAERVQAGVYLGRLGDPRPGVCTVPPPMVPIAGGNVVIGVLPDEAEEHEQAYVRAGTTAENACKYTQEDTSPTGTPLSIAAFEIARYPVTNAQYALFIEAGGYDPAADWWDEPGRAWLTGRRRTAPAEWNSPRLGISHPNRPVVDVTWYEAMAFCRWLTTYLNDGYQYRLPSEAEWEYVARGAERRRYPWGSAEPDAERANHANIYNGTTAVGCFPTGVTPEGIQDLAGNVWEWTRSVFAPYPYDPADGREDTADPAEKSLTTRGGAWNYHPITLRAAARDHDNPPDHFNNLGLRLARHVPANQV